VIVTDYLTGSLLTLVLPVALVVVVAIWWVAMLRRKEK
jgi:cytochrome c-type biogenesis protein CcmH/NrfF